MWIFDHQHLLLAIQVAAEALPQAVEKTQALTKDTNSISTTMVVSAAAAYIMQWLKNSTWFPALSQDSSLWYQRGFAILLAVATSLGIHYSYDATVGVLTITGLIGSSLYDHAVDFVKSFVMQQLTYDAAIKPYPPRE